MESDPHIGAGLGTCLGRVADIAEDHRVRLDCKGAVVQKALAAGDKLLVG